MQDNDVTNFSEIMIGVGEIYCKEINKSMIRLYWKILSRFDYIDVAKAFNSHIENPDSGQFFPKPADIVKFIDGTGQTRGLEAWSKLDCAIRTVGPYSSVVFDDAIIHAVVTDMGGWIRFGYVLENDLPFLAQEFQKRYHGYLHNPPKTYLRCLLGISAAENIQKGKKGTLIT